MTARQNPIPREKAKYLTKMPSAGKMVEGIFIYEYMKKMEKVNRSGRI